MSAPLNIEYTFQELEDSIHDETFNQFYRNLSLNDQDFQAVVQRIMSQGFTSMPPTELFMELLTAECSNVSRVTQVFKAALRARKECWVVEGFKMLTESRQCDDFRPCLCSCIVESVWQEDRFILLRWFWCYIDLYDRHFVSCLFRKFLVMSLQDRNPAGHLAELDQWLCGKSRNVPIKIVYFVTQSDRVHFEFDFGTEHVKLCIDWCLDRGHHYVALYMLYLRQDFGQIIDFIHKIHFNRPAHTEVLRFLTMLGIQLAITHEAFNVMFALFDLYEHNNRQTDLKVFFRHSMYYPPGWASQRQKLVELCEHRGSLKWAMFLRILSEDWQGVENALLSSMDTDLVDFTLLTAHKTWRSWSYLCRLFARSSKTSTVVASMIINAMELADVDMVRTLVKECRDFDANTIFGSWPDCCFPSSIVIDQQCIGRPEDTAISLAQVFIQTGVMCRYRVWFEQNMLAECSVEDPESCNTCTFHHCDLALVCNMPNLVRLFVTYGRLPSRKLLQLKNCSQLRYLLQKKRRTECLQVLDSIDNSPRRLEHLCCLSVSALVGCHSGREDRLKSLGLPEACERMIMFDHIMF